MKTRTGIGIVLAVVMAWSIGAMPSIAQEVGIDRKIEEQRMQELRGKIEKIKYEKLKDALAMDDETAKKFFETYHPAEKDIQGIVKQRNEEVRKLRQMMNGAKSDADVDPAMAKIRDLNHQIEDRVVKLDNDLRPVLSPRQRAKLMVFEKEFNKRVQREVERHHIAKERRQEMRRNFREMKKLRRMEMRKQLNRP